MKIYIIRHGETTWNTQKRLQGVSNTELNEKGIELAKVTGEALKEVPFYCCFTSPLKRAKDTAFLALNNRNIPVFEDERIREISFGVWEGVDPELLPQKEVDKFFHHPELFHAPEGGEELLELCERMKDFWEDIISREELQDKTILVATHGCAMRALLRNVYEDTRIENYWHGSCPPNCSVNIVEIKDNRAFLLEEDVVYY